MTGVGRTPLLLLASASPRRRELLSLAGVHFEAVATSVEEAHDGAPEAVVAENALRKAHAGLQLRPGAELVLGADTEVAIGGRVLGKAASADGAREHLAELSGQTHEVLGAIALLAGDGSRAADRARAHPRQLRRARRGRDRALHRLGGVEGSCRRLRRARPRSLVRDRRRRRSGKRDRPADAGAESVRARAFHLWRDLCVGRTPLPRRRTAVLATALE